MRLPMADNEEHVVVLAMASELIFLMDYSDKEFMKQLFHVLWLEALETSRIADLYINVYARNNITLEPVSEIYRIIRIDKLLVSLFTVLKEPKFSVSSVDLAHLNNLHNKYFAELGKELKRQLTLWEEANGTRKSA